MSRRYGRNQKRRHRARIAELEHAFLVTTVERNKAQGERDEHAKRHRDLLLTIERLSPHSVLLPIKRTSLYASHLAFEWSHDLPRPLTQFMTERDKAPRERFTRDVFRVRMHRIRAWVEIVFRDSEVRKLLHVEARDSKGRWVHTVSWNAVDRFGDLKDLQAYVIEVILDALSRDRATEARA